VPLKHSIFMYRRLKPAATENTQTKACGYQKTQAKACGYQNS